MQDRLYPQDEAALIEKLQAMMYRPRPRVKTLGEMTPEELLAELRDAEAQRQEWKCRRGAEASQVKAWARRRKADIKAEFQRRGLPVPRGRDFRQWAGVS